MFTWLFAELILKKSLKLLDWGWWDDNFRFYGSPLFFGLKCLILCSCWKFSNFQEVCWKTKFPFLPYFNYSIMISSFTAVLLVSKFLRISPIPESRNSNCVLFCSVNLQIILHIVNFSIVLCCYFIYFCSRVFFVLFLVTYTSYLFRTRKWWRFWHFLFHYFFPLVISLPVYPLYSTQFFRNLFSFS